MPDLYSFFSLYKPLYITGTIVATSMYQMFGWMTDKIGRVKCLKMNAHALPLYLWGITFFHLVDSAPQKVEDMCNTMCVLCFIKVAAPYE